MLNFYNSLSFFDLRHGGGRFSGNRHATTTGGLSVIEFSSVERIGCDHDADQVSESLLHKRILETERDQKADKARIEEAIEGAEKEIARLEQRQGHPERLHQGVSAIRDRVVLAVREVRKNMQRRALAADRMQGGLSTECRQRSRFAVDDPEDKNLRKRFMELLARTPTSALINHLRRAMEAGHAACAELIRFEFQCRDDKREFISRFNTVVAHLSAEDPVEMHKRLANIRKGIEQVDARVAGLLQRVQSLLHGSGRETAAA